MKAFIICLFTLFVFAGQAFGQGQDEQVVIYDPLFWKDELKLRDSQYRSIQQINTEFYAFLEASTHDTSIDHKKLKAIAREGLLERSHKIWNTLHPGQKRKWKRLWENRYGNVW